ncbi:MAG: 30S ribosomal protein S4 [Candidatus Electryonea clarkiae]|nr:30S ribosomal protein S4 [Candidatus Electryonea clarkiae]MDP8288600.1 30S ribosomal protein S4 [Candidatus Electryonea clarkiae]
MARYTGAVCKTCRREGAKLFLKGERCYGAKCSFERKEYAPGQHGQNRRRKRSEYGTQLREKQKIRRTYGILETQFHNYYEKAASQKGITGENLLSMLERRLDNVIYRIGFASSLRAARQLVRHRHFLVNGKLVDIPSFIVTPGDIVQVKDKSRKLKVIHDSLRRVKEGRQISYLELDKARLMGRLSEFPARVDIPVDVNEQAVVELYSK